METKICTKCGEEKDHTNFSKGKLWCKLCCSEYNKEYYRKNPETKIKNAKIYREKHRDEILEKNKKYRENNPQKVAESRARYKLNNLEKYKESQKKYREANIETIKAKIRIYAHKNPDKTRDRQIKYRKTAAGKYVAIKSAHLRRSRVKCVRNSLTLLQWEKILETQGNKCAICGKAFCKSRKPTMDHIIPLSKGGGLTFENVQALCGNCNSSKSAKLDHSKIVTWGVFA